MVETQTVGPLELGAPELIAELERLQQSDRPSAIVFDADGTLWSGDVGEDVFGFATERGLLRGAASAELGRAAERFGVTTHADPNQTARAMFQAYLAGSYPELPICEMMTWCYAGYRLEELEMLVQSALSEAGIETRVRRELEPILGFARARGIRCTVVSASPLPIVRQAARLFGFEPSDIAASEFSVQDGVVRPALARAVPYEKAKCGAARNLFGDADWLASFGDNVFDIDMLCAARLGVAVHPKPGLLARLPALSSVVLLR